MDIKVNEYVRTREGIRKILGKIKTQYIYDEKKIATFDEYEIDKLYKKGLRITKEESRELKHSFKPIDLIEEGDYVNGRLVLQVDYKNKNVCLLIPFTDTQANTNICWYGYEDIKTVVTKEQFENEKYIVGD